MQTPVDISLGLESGVAKIAAITKEEPKLRNQLRDYFENRNSDIIQSINDEIIIPGIEKLQRTLRKGSFLTSCLTFVGSVMYSFSR